MRRPNCPVKVKALNALAMSSVEMVESMQLKKVSHARWWDQKLEISSRTKSSPPMGAPKAEATPAAAPAEMKLRRSYMLRKRLKGAVIQPFRSCVPWLSTLPTDAPMAIMGPSFPPHKPEETASATETNLTTSVLKAKNFGMETPLRYAITSGTPDPAATGSR